MDGKEDFLFVHPQKVISITKINSTRLLFEPSIMNKMLNYNLEYQKDSTIKANDFINKKDLMSNDIFCLVFLTLNICQTDFVSVYSYLSDHNDCLIKFNRVKFKALLDNFLLHISFDKDLLFVFKKLLNFEKYDSGKVLIGRCQIIFRTK
jgi:hypothetical protein